MAPKQDLRLVVNADSWHFRYFTFIRKQWGLSPPTPQTSLCPYCQTMFWGSASMMLFGVFLVMGWLEIKLARIVYKLLAKLGAKRLIVLLSPAADVVDNRSLKMEESFAFTALGVAMTTLGVMGAGVALIYVVGIVGWNVFLAIPLLPGAVWTGVLCIGWALFFACAGIGFVLHHSGIFLGWLFTNGSLWATIAMWAGLGLGAAAILSVMSYVVYLLFSSKIMKRFGGWALSRVNGFKAARELAEKSKTVTHRTKRSWAWLSSSRQIDISGATAIMLGPLGILWVYIKAIKKNVCPMISFVDSEGGLSMTGEKSVLLNCSIL